MNVLVLCTGNSCRSILGEVLLNDLGGDRISAYSAGSDPAGSVHPGALQKLEQEGHSTDGLSSKSWDVFAGDDAPQMNLVITVCDSAAREACPVWYGGQVRVHWGIPDPAKAPDEEKDVAFDLAYRQLRDRIADLMQIPFESTDPRHLEDALQRIHDAAQVREQADD